MLVLHISSLKFAVLAFIDFEFRTLCLFNFEHLDELKETGKKFPLTGMLRGFSDWGFAFITDDTLFCSVQTHDNFSQPLLSNTKKYNSKATNESEIIFDQDFLQSKMGNAFDGEVQDYFRPFQVNQLKQFGVKFIKDI